MECFVTNQPVATWAIVIVGIYEKLDRKYWKQLKVTLYEHHLSNVVDNLQPIPWDSKHHD